MPLDDMHINAGSEAEAETELDSGIPTPVRNALRNVGSPLLHAARDAHRRQCSQRQRLRAVFEERCELQEQVHQLKGSIRVLCRTRPLLLKELEAGDTACAKPIGAQSIVLLAKKKAKIQKQLSE